MPLKRVRPPRSIQGSTERDHAAWERQVQDQVGDTELTLGEVERLLFLDRNFSAKTNELQRQIDCLIDSVGLIRQTHTEEIHRHQVESNRRVAMLSNSVEELKRKLNEQEHTTWLLPLN